jgi:DNA mismatch endonuclease (patch repair protein)
MTDPAIPRDAVSATTSRRMSRQRTRDTAPELRLRRELHRRGLRYKVDCPIPGLVRRRADVLFSHEKVAVFVDGCFWHGCPEHKTSPTNNEKWWAAKLTRNVERDQQTSEHLASRGWAVLRFWEHEDMFEAADVVERAVRAARERGRT